MTHVQRRDDLSDGRSFQVVKLYYEPEELEAQLVGLDWRPRVWATGDAFIVGTATAPEGATPSPH